MALIGLSGMFGDHAPFLQPARWLALCSETAPVQATADQESSTAEDLGNRKRSPVPHL